MPLHSRKNQYQGINAHLHSALQSEEGGWEVFHVMHISHLAETLNDLLPDGYSLDPEKSMQIRQYHPETGLPIKPLHKNPDITLYDYAAKPAPAYAPSLATPTLTLPAVASLDIDLDDQSYLRAIVIREIREDATLGKPITWIELLSPTNKPPRPGYHLYQEKRRIAIQAGIALVEIDYLHETRSPVPHVASYPDQEANAFPYTVVVTNPRPTLDDGRMEIYGFVVEAILPSVVIPLSGEDRIILDFNQVYQRTVNSLTSFSQRVDYTALPINFDRYHPADQERIRQVMERVQATHSQA